MYLAAKNIYQACKLNESLHSIHYDKNCVPQIHACKRLQLSKVGVAPKIFLRIFLLWIFFVLSLATLQKGSNDATLSQNYRPIALASSLSKVLERFIISKYETFFHSNALQFGFKRGHSTSLCTATVKNVVSHYMHNGSAVLGCFLDASKAFDLVDHGILFQKPLDHGLLLPVINFLLSWYCSQQMRVRWGDSLSGSFNVSYGVRQGRVLSPLLFAVYLDELLAERLN